MSFWGSVLLLVHIIVSVSLIILVLIQQGKGADAGASFGSSSSTSLFGASGASNFLSRTTAILASLFFILCLLLAYINSYDVMQKRSVMESAAQEQMAGVSAEEEMDDKIPN